jgi:hypothetical protein
MEPLEDQDATSSTLGGVASAVVLGRSDVLVPAVPA